MKKAKEENFDNEKQRLIIKIISPIWVEWLCPKCGSLHTEQIFAENSVCKHQCSWCGEVFDCIIEFPKKEG